jgi:MFS family permease
MAGSGAAVIRSKLTRVKRNNITILHLITFFSSLYFYHQIITLYFQERGLNYVQINSLWGIIVGSKAIAEVPTGLIADRVGRRFSIIVALALQLVGEIVFIFADSYLIFVAVSVIAGIGFAFLSGCFEAMMYDSLKSEGKEDEMQKVSGLNDSFAQLAIIMGSLTGGFIASDLRIESFILVILITASFVAMALVVSFFLSEPTSEYKRSEQSTFALLKDGIGLLKSNRALRRIVLLYLLATPFINYLLNLYQPYFVEANVLGVWFGIALSMASLLGVLTSRYAYLLERRFGVNKGVLMATCLPGIFYILMATISHSWISIALFVLAYSSMNMQKPIFVDYTNRHIESKSRATVLSLISMFSGVYVALMGLVIGGIADISLSWSFVFMGSIIIISTLLVRIEEIHVETVS